MRRSNTSVSAYCSSGSAPGCSPTSLTIAATSSASTRRPLRSAGLTIACSSSSGAKRQHHLGALAHQLAEAGVQQRPVVEIGPQRDDHPDAAVRVGDGGEQAVEEVRAHRLVLDQREELLELVDHQHQLGLIRRPART